MLIIPLSLNISKHPTTKWRTLLVVIEQTSYESQTTFIDFRKPHFSSFSFSWSLFIIINCNGHMQLCTVCEVSRWYYRRCFTTISESWSQVHGSSCQNIVLVYLSIPSHQIFVHMHSFTSTIPWWHPQSNSVTLASSFFDTTIILVPYRAILDWFLVCPVATCQCSIPCLTYSNSSPTADLSLISSMVAFFRSLCCDALYPGKVGV